MSTSSKVRTGMMFATSAAALVLAGCATHSAHHGDKHSMEKDSMAKAGGGNVQCAGINTCKGTSECKTATSSCKGLNDCAGHGFITTSAAECSTKGGMPI